MLTLTALFVTHVLHKLVVSIKLDLVSVIEIVWLTH
jgi:hypothetical protein